MTRTTKRKYDSSRRQAQARETRRLITEAAGGLFFERGYAGATMDAIAQAAGVATETVYAVFGSKRKILAHLLDVAVGGDDQPIQLLDRPGPQAVLHAPDQHTQIKMFSHDISNILRRAAPVMEIIRSAARTEPELNELLQNLFRRRLENMTAFVTQLARKGGLRQGIDISEGAELAWTLTSPEVYLLLTRDRKYSNDEYIAWLEASLSRLLLD